MSRKIWVGLAFAFPYVHFGATIIDESLGKAAGALFFLIGAFWWYQQMAEQMQEVHDD